MKVALISETLPPAKSGQAMVLYRLFEGFGPDEYCLLSRWNWEETVGASSRQPRLPGRFYQLVPRFEITRGYRFGLSHMREKANLVIAAFMRARQVADVIRREKCDAVVACTGDLLDLPASYMASRWMGIPFYAYIFDHYSYREWSDPARRFLAGLLEPKLMRAAAGVIAPNEILREELRRQYGVEATVIHNAFDTSEYEALAEGPPAILDSEVRIVYTGDIYEAHYDAFRNLLDAIERLARTDVRLHLYTSRTLDELAGMNLRGAIALHDFLPLTEMPQVQRQADLLFLPLAFNSPYPNLVRTSSTTKLGEYLAAGSPMLVHAPPDSFVSWYCREHQCGMVVDQNDPAVLAEAIKRVLGDVELRRRLGARARERVRADFSISTARRKFRELIEGGRSRALAA